MENTNIYEQSTNIYADPPPEPRETGPPIFFPVSPFKLTLMSIVTFGTYQYYWFYKQWKGVKQFSEPDIKPFWRTFFAPLFCYSLFEKISAAAESHETPTHFNSGFFAAGWILLTFCVKLPDPYWLITIFSVFLLLPVQKTANQLNALVSPDHNPNSRLSGWNITAVIFGTLMIGLMFLGLFGPPTTVVPGTELSQRQVQLLQDNAIVDPDEQILMFCSAGIFSILENGSLVTNTRVIAYEKLGEDISIYDARYHEIADIIVEEKGNDWINTLVKIALANGDFFFIYLSAQDQGDERFLEIIHQKLESVKQGG